MKSYVIQYNSDFTGCGFWRFLWPQFILNMMGASQIHHTHLFLRDYLHYARVNVVHIQRQSKPRQYHFFKKLSAIRDRLGFRLIYDADDVIFREDVPDFNRGKQEILDDDVRNSQQSLIELCDEMTVSTPFLRDYYSMKTSQSKISVIPNYMPLLYGGNLYDEHYIVNNYNLSGKRFKIIYFASPSHFDIGGMMSDDFSHVRDAVIATKDEFHWIFVGAFPPAVAPYVENGEMSFYEWKTIHHYIRFLKSLGANMAIAPLKDNIFNRGKSDIKFLEATAIGLPIACQDIVAYNVANIKFVSGDDMINRIRDTLSSKDRMLDVVREAKESLDRRWLENTENVGRYYDLYSFPYGDSKRTYL